MSEKFGPQTEAKWNEHLGDSKKSPLYKELGAFLNRRIHSLLASTDVAPTVVNNPQKRGRSVVHNVSVQNCVNCNASHGLAKCKKFLSLLVEQRRALALEKRACFNCLQLNHFAQCSSKSRCARCRRSHHTLLHPEEDRTTRRIGKRESDTGNPESQPVASPSSAVGNDVVAHVQAAHPKLPRKDRGVLPTAWVNLHTTEGRRVPIRVLLDQCSTLSFISESLCRMLRTKRQRTDVTISDVAGMEKGSVRTTYRVSLGLSPRGKPVPMIPLTAYVLPNIILYMTPRTQPLDTWPHLRGIELADPDPSSQHPIHMLIGSNLFMSILVPEPPRLGPKDVPAVQKTVFGWILSGPAGVARPVPDKAHVSPCAAESDTNILVCKFWEEKKVP